MSESYIYSGVWLNWSRGPILGWTLTLPSTQAQLLTAFLAVYVTLAGAQFWKIFSYIVHQWRAAPLPGDGQHQQMQAILRNTGTPLGASWQLLMLGWQWRKIASKGFGPVLIVAVLGVFHAVGWGLAGVFSSSVTKISGDEVLIRGTSCGFYSDSSGSTDTAFLRSKNLNATAKATTYARQCYGTSQHKSFCDQYIVPQIPWKSNANASCPFDPEFCAFNGTAAAFEMDTGLLDSNGVFGVNTRSSQRIGYRRITTCAPIEPPSSFVRIENETNSAGTQTYVRYYFGPTPVANFSYGYNINSYNSGSGYELHSLEAIATDNRKWDPIPELNRTDADVALLILAANWVQYDEPVDDPWFSAHDLLQFDSPYVNTLYKPDYYVRFLGCMEQHQFCTLNSKSGAEFCTPLTGIAALLSAMNKTSTAFSPVQFAIAGRLWLNLLETSMSSSAINENSLQAYNSLWDSIITSLPNNQWQIEVTNWYNIALAKFQDWIVEYSRGPSFIRKGSVIAEPLSKADRDLCSSQKVHQTSSHVSFSLLGLLIVLVFGGSIIFASLFIDTLVGFFQRRFHIGEHKAIQWTLDEKLQLQRMVYEKAGIGSWNNCDGRVPTTTEEVRQMGVVVQDLDGKHPTYRRDADPYVTDSLLERRELALLLETRQQEELKKGGYASVRPVSPMSPGIRY